MRCAQLGDGRLLVLLDRRLLARKPERCVFGVIAEGLNLAGKRPHVRAQPHREIAVRVELARLRMLLRLVENGEKRVERALVDRHAALIERKRHRLHIPPQNRRRTAARRPCMHANHDDINLARRVPQVSAPGASEIGLDDRPRLAARDHGDDLERHAAAAPLENPGLDEPQIVAAHELEAAGKVGLDPAVDIFEALRQRPAGVAQAPVDRDHVVVAETFDHHEQHRRRPSRGGLARQPAYLFASGGGWPSPAAGRDRSRPISARTWSRWSPKARPGSDRRAFRRARRS